MPDTDPLALRHGMFVAAAWAQISQARGCVRANLSTTTARAQLHQIRHLQAKTRDAHAREIRRDMFTASEIDSWFWPLERTLDKAEAYFDRQAVPRPTKAIA